MEKGPRRTTRTFAAILFAGMVAAGTYAFTASNTVPGSNAGDGSAAISGYTVSNIHYTPSVADPTLLTSYSFDLDTTAASVTAKPLSTQLTWDTCANTVGNSWTCTATVGTTILSLDTLRVIAVQ